MKSFIVSVVYILYVSTILTGQDLTGDWYGKLDLGGPKLKLALYVTDTLGYLQANLDSPNQGVHGIVTDTIYIEQDSIHFIITKLNVSFAGALGDWDINGTFSQNGFHFPLVLSRIEEAEEEESNRRPQDPVKIDYYEEEVIFPNFQDSVVLSGTLTMPFDPEINKTVILLTGSGPQNRNEELVQFNHRPFLVLSDYLTRQGIAVLRYDDRGVGQSSGNFATSTTEDFMHDAMAAIDFIKSRPDLEDSEIGLIGHSEGGLIASMIGDSVDFLVLLGTPGTSIPDLLIAQHQLLSKAQGIPDSIIHLGTRTNARIYQTALNFSHVSNDSLATILQRVFELSFKKYPAEFLDRVPDMEQFTMNQAKSVANNWFRYFIAFDPQSYLSKITHPVLAITGTLDMQVPYSTNLPAIELALQKAGNTQYEVYAFNGVNHLFQTAVNGTAQEYGLLTETFNEDVMTAIAEWIIRQ